MKSAAATCSKTRDGVLDAGSRTQSSSEMTLGPPHRFCRILISRLIFFFLTGLRILITQRSPVGEWTPSKTSEYFPRPTLRTTS